MYAKVNDLDSGLFEATFSLFNFGLQGGQQYTNRQFLVKSLFKSVKRLRLGSVQKKWG